MGIDNWLSLILFAGYVVVFFIQRNLYIKQKSLIEIYQNLISVFGDTKAIENYVELNKKNVELDYQIKKKELENLNQQAKGNLDETETLLNDVLFASDDKARVAELMEKSSRYIDYRKQIDDKLLALASDEIDKIYDYITSESNKLQGDLKYELEKNITLIRSEYIIKKTDLLENRKKIDDM